MELPEHTCDDCGNPFNPIEVARAEAGTAITDIFDSLDDWEAAVKADDLDESGGLVIHINMQILTLIDSLMDMRYAVTALQVGLEDPPE